MREPSPQRLAECLLLMLWTAPPPGTRVEFDRRIIAWHRSSATSKRLDAIPGVGPTLATALVASIADPKAFRSGRDFSAWVGLVPKQLERRQGQAWQYQQTRRSLFAQPVHGWRACRHPLCQDPRLRASTPRSPLCWHGVRPSSPPSRSPTRLLAWRGP
jgi:Transposase IS116/IS110/IS902 family